MIDNVEINNNSFIVIEENCILKVEQWAENSIRVICSPNYRDNINQGIDELNRKNDENCCIVKTEDKIELITGDLVASYDGYKLVFSYKSKIILEEFSRYKNCALKIRPREFSYLSENSYKTTLRFEADLNEKIYGMGSYQETNLNKNFSSYELMHRNSQTSIPFYISNKNYGFIWNNSSVGKVNFSKNCIQWESNNSECIDYIVIAGENCKKIIENYTYMIGRSPLINKKLLGLWQSKLRYQTKDELEKVYLEYKKRNIDLSVLIIDYYHWTEDGEFEFDNDYWEGIDELANETEIMVSLWPTVTPQCKYYSKYLNEQMIIKSNNGRNHIYDNKYLLDFFNPKTKLFLNELLEKNYKNRNIQLFWADQAEPEMDIYNHKQYETYNCNFEKIANKYPLEYIKSINKRNDYPVLIRSAWFNSQKYGALVWSGDIESTFESLKKQIQCSISMGLSGISWFTTDIGGFYTPNPNTEEFRELLIRWFQFSTFSPVLRMHGDRYPHTKRLSNVGGGKRTSGGPNEIYSYGKEVEKILIKFLDIRIKLREYIYRLYKESSEFGYPIIRSLFFEYPDDENCWCDDIGYMFGSELYIYPITEFNIKNVRIYFPKGCNWIDIFNNCIYEGGKYYEINTSLDEFPVFLKHDSYLVNDFLKGSEYYGN